MDIEEKARKQIGEGAKHRANVGALWYWSEKEEAEMAGLVAGIGVSLTS